MCFHWAKDNRKNCDEMFATETYFVNYCGDPLARPSRPSIISINIFIINLSSATVETSLNTTLVQLFRFSSPLNAQQSNQISINVASCLRSTLPTVYTIKTTLIFVLIKLKFHSSPFHCSDFIPTHRHGIKDKFVSIYHLIWRPTRINLFSLFSLFPKQQHQHQK